jgi:hypothetical protein
VYVTHRADLFVSFPSQTVEAIAKVLSPITVVMTDRTFSEISLFLRMMSLAMQRRPDWVEQIVNKMEGVPELRKTQLLALTAQVYNASQKRALANAGKDFTEPAGRPAAGTRVAGPNAASPASAASPPGVSRVVSTPSQGTARE